MVAPITRTTGDGTAINVKFFDADGNPIELQSGGIPVYVLNPSSGGSVTWPLAIDLLTSDPMPQAGKVLFYALTDGVASPNNVITLKYLFPDGTQVINQVMTV